METINKTPTRARDYAVLSGVYGTALAALGWAHGRDPERRGNALTATEFLWNGAATFALAQSLVHEKIDVWLRRPFLDEHGENQQDAEHAPRGHGLRFAIGELLSCTRCSGAWASLALTGLQVVWPPGGRIATRVLATAAANDLLEIAFAWGRQEANLISEHQARLDRQASGRGTTVEPGHSSGR